jgi:Lar family restriction alleviation protein
MTEQIKDALRECPFCGNAPQTKEWQQGNHIAMRIWCDECSVETRVQAVKQRAIAAWNTRAPATITDDAMQEIPE